jgi:hypothetical protein
MDTLACKPYSPELNAEHSFLQKNGRKVWLLGKKCVPLQPETGKKVCR